MSALKFIEPSQWLSVERYASVLFYSPRGDVTVGSMTLAVAELQAQLQELPGTRIGIGLKDAALFTLGLLATWAAHKEAILLPEDAAGYLQTHQQDFDALLHEDVIAGLACPQLQLVTDRFATVKAHPSLPQLTFSDDCTVRFFTSGSAGTPKQVPKQLSQLLTESRMLFDMLADTLEGCVVCASVLAQHLYGMTFRIMLPLCFGLPARTEWLRSAYELYKLPSARYFLVSTPSFLKQLNVHAPAQPQLALISSAGSFLPKDVAQAVLNWSGAQFLEIYGSTESSVMGWRRQPQAHYQPFPGVSFIMGQQFYQLRSPLLITQDLNISDILEFYPDGTFKAFGRYDSIIKLDAVPVSLSAIKARLLQHTAVADAEVVSYQRGDQLCIGAAIVAEPSSPFNQSALTQQLGEDISRTLGANSRPQRFVFVDDFAQNSLGKRTLSSLRQLFA